MNGAAGPVRRARIALPEGGGRPLSFTSPSTLDSAPDLPEPDLSDPLQVHGRGLQLVDAVAIRWATIQGHPRDDRDPMVSPGGDCFPWTPRSATRGVDYDHAGTTRLTDDQAESMAQAIDDGVELYFSCFQ